MKCPKCFVDGEFNLTRDKRGVPEAHCKECGAFVKKLSTNEALDYYEQKLKSIPMDVAPAPVSAPAAEQEETPNQNEDKMMCKWCCENYFMRYGRLGTVYTPIEAQYCPMCGRKRKPSDRDY